MFFGSVLKVISAEHSVLRVVRGEHLLRAMGKAHVPFNIESEYLDPIVVLPLHGLLPGIELLPLINVLATGIASPAHKLATQADERRGHSHGERRHQSNNLLRISWTGSPWDEIWVKVRGEILVEDLALRHVGCLSSRWARVTWTRQSLQNGSTPENIAITMQFWKPGTVGPGSLLDRASETEDVVLSSAPTPAALSLQAQRERLPIFKHRKVQDHEQGAYTNAEQQGTSCCVRSRPTGFSSSLVKLDAGKQLVSLSLLPKSIRG